MKSRFELTVFLALISLAATAEEGKPYPLAAVDQLKNPCVEGVAVTLSAKAERARSFTATPEEFLEPLKHPFLTGILYPEFRKEILVVNRLIKSNPGVFCPAVDENQRIYPVTFGEEYKGVGTAYNAALESKDGKKSKFQITLNKDEAIISAYEIVDRQARFYQSLDWRP